MVMPWLARLEVIAGSRLSAGCREAPTQTAAPMAPATSSPRLPSTTLRALTALRLAWLDDQLDFCDFHRVPVAVGDFVLEITQAVSVPRGLRRVVVLEGLSQPVPVVGAAVGALGPVGHDDVRVTVGLVTGPAVRMLDHLDQPVDMGIRTKIVPVNVLVIVPVRHRPMLPVEGRSDETAAGEEQPHQPRRRAHQ